MNNDLSLVPKDFYNKYNLIISKFKIEEESSEYAACRFEVNNLKIVSRKAKITPKKVGQFVTFWKRNANGIIEPLNELDSIDVYVVNVKKENQRGQFVFPKEVLIQKRIISTKKREGKRGFRVYPQWDIPSSKQAQKTQQWQLKYFFEISAKTDFESIYKLYGLPI